jgi:hypothetical protein
VRRSAKLAQFLVYKEGWMLTDEQFRKLGRLRKAGHSLAIAAAKAGMSENTARKYLQQGKPPSEVRPHHSWRTREDPFAEVWDELKSELEVNPGLEAKTLFQELQRRFPGRFQDGQLRTLQRKVKTWRALEGPAKEVFFPQIHYPGVLCQSDFSHMAELGITLAGQAFDHLLYHFVLTYSNWEWGTLCYSESFESLAAGLQKALFELGGVPQIHQTDRLGAALKIGCPEAFQTKYQALLDHYELQGRKTQPYSANENGDVEQRHHRLKRALDQALLLRGHRNFESIQAYEQFLNRLFAQLNAGRSQKLTEERVLLKPLPAQALNSWTRLRLKVGSSSTIRVQHNTYSVNSRLIGEEIDVHLYAEHLEIWFAQRRLETLPRLRGQNQHRVNYRHVIDWLVRKPGAFENYRYQADLFPSSQFRMAYDHLRARIPAQANKEYLALLHLAAREGESQVESALRFLFGQGAEVSAQAVNGLLCVPLPAVTDVEIAAIDLSVYNQLYQEPVWSH